MVHFLDDHTQGRRSLRYPSIPIQITHWIATNPSILIVLSLFVLLISLLMIFVGRAIAKIAVFISSGLLMAFLIAAVASIFLGPAGILIGFMIGFIIGGLIGLLLLPLGVGLAFGISGYILAQSILGLHLFSIIMALLLFLIGVIFADELLTIFIIAIGSILFFSTVTSLGLNVILSFALTLALSLLGFIVQSKEGIKSIE